MKRLTSLLLGLLCPLVFSAPAPLAIDPAQSRIEIVVPCTMDSFTGTLDAYRADITVEAGRVTAGKLAFNFTDVHTGKAARDETMHEWQATPKNPSAAFVLRTLEPIEGSRFTAHGSLTLHGITNELAFPVSVTTDQQRYAIDGEAPLDTRSYGLPVIRKFGLLKVEPLIKVRFHLQGIVKVGEVNPAAPVTAPAAAAVTVP